MIQEFGLHLVSVIPGAQSARVLNALLQPSPEPYWKLGYKGGCQDIFFLTTLDRTPFRKNSVSLEKRKVPTSDIGFTFSPSIRG
jgi:hypothetical protein